MVISNDCLIEILPDARLNIRKKYNLENDKMDQSVDMLDQWVKKQIHFMNKSFDQSYLEMAIIVCKGSVEKAKMQIDKLCTFKTLLSKYFVDGGMKDICASVDDIMYSIPLPITTKEYQRIFLIQIHNNDITSTVISNIYKKALVIADYLKHHDYTDGFVIVNDLRYVNIKDLITKINFIELQQFFSILIEGFGARITGIHVISQSKFIDLFAKVIKPLLSEKLQKRIHIYPDLDELHQVVDKELLPVEFGGNQRPMKELQDAWVELLCSPEYEEHLARMKASKTDESLRQKEKFNELYLGLPGSFRTLTVD